MVLGTSRQRLWQSKVSYFFVSLSEETSSQLPVPLEHHYCVPESSHCNGRKSCCFSCSNCRWNASDYNLIVKKLYLKRPSRCLPGWLSTGTTCLIIIPLHLFQTGFIENLLQGVVDKIKCLTVWVGIWKYCIALWYFYSYLAERLEKMVLWNICLMLWHLQYVAGRYRVLFLTLILLANKWCMCACTCTPSTSFVCLFIYLFLPGHAVRNWTPSLWLYS